MFVILCPRHCYSWCFPKCTHLLLGVWGEERGRNAQWCTSRLAPLPPWHYPCPMTAAQDRCCCLSTKRQAVIFPRPGRWVVGGGTANPWRRCAQFVPNYRVQTSSTPIPFLPQHLSQPFLSLRVSCSLLPRFTCCFIFSGIPRVRLGWGREQGPVLGPWLIRLQSPRQFYCSLSKASLDIDKISKIVSFSREHWISPATPTPPHHLAIRVHSPGT